jgi:hypothetical protein
MVLAICAMNSSRRIPGRFRTRFRAEVEQDSHR